MTDPDWLVALRRFRQDSRLTQREFAVFLGVNQKTISRWERGIDQPNLETRERLRILLEDSNADGMPRVYEAIRNAPIPIALVDGHGNVLVASGLYSAPNGGASPSQEGDAALPTVLVIEDDPAVLKATRAVLKRWHFLTVGATDGEAAVAMVANGSVRPAAAIIDFLLPGSLDGIDTAAALQKAIPNLPVLIVSGEITPERMNKISASGLPFVRKPVEPYKIKTTMFAMLHKSNG